MNGYERTLMRKCKGLATEVHQQRVDMDRSGLRQFSDNSEIGELKREYVKVQNEANLALEREKKLSRDIEDAQRFKQELIDDIEEIRKHKSDMLEPQLIAATKEIKVNASSKLLGNARYSPGPMFIVGGIATAASARKFAQRS